ncbi:MAG: PD-(D/E)XK nuclease family protein [Verrucomicrobiota bacterium]
MQARMLLGPAGSGKTFRCLAEIREALRASPEGPPLILLAPKQATFQLERQLLADPAAAGLDGYTRLHIFSFERLAQFVLEQLQAAPPQLLAEESRVMVLRALLMRHEDELKLFGRSARRPGFARELSRLLGELQQHQFTPAKLRALADRLVGRRELQDKLHDLALLLKVQAHWLADHELQDANRLLDFATDALRETGVAASRQSAAIPLKKCGGLPTAATIQQLWLDGFAEMTPQELDLLAAILPRCKRATLAFCLENEPKAETAWFSIWSSVGKTFQQCRQRLANLPRCEIEIEILPRDPRKNRFAKHPGLSRLEKDWTSPVTPNSELPPPPPAPARQAAFQSASKWNEDGRTPNSAISITACQNPEAEATFAAREILKFVRAGARFRDSAVLVRNLDGYYKPLACAFRRYDVPFFLDRRESVAHHPLAELTRGALRTIAFDWRHDDWFAALKTGFSGVEETEIDRLENAALESGWRGKKWREASPAGDAALERLRQKILPPFENLAVQLARHQNQPTGGQLAEALRKLWDELDVEAILERWSLDESNSEFRTSNSALHQTVWEQMNVWLDSVALAFSREALPLRDWLPVLEAGLANLTVGVIPPVLDEVLVGAIDRARNPNLKFALVLGVNESVFPAAPAAPPILTDADRDQMEQGGATLGPDLRERLARERYYGYIACTRASQRLAVTFARHDADGNTLNPSPFVSHLQRLFPKLEIGEFGGEISLAEAVHPVEIAAPLLNLCSSPAMRDESAHSETSEKSQSRLTSAATVEGWSELLELPPLKSLAESLRRLREPDPAENLSPALAEKLFGPVLRTSVSRLEEFAQCPFRFFVRSGLRAGERRIFELDARERGSFQHDVLKVFHERLAAEGTHWRDLTPPEARERIRAVAVELTDNFRGGLMRDTAQTRFEARAMTESLQDFIEVVVTWLRGQNEFDPAAAELDFGGDDAPAPALELDLDDGHRLALQGRIDRVDLWREPGGDTALALVLDYKSSGKKLDPILAEHGVQLQLLTYLNVLRHWPDPRGVLGAARLVPAGAFYVNLRGQYESGRTRAEVLDDAGDARKRAYRHTGRFDAGALPKLDRRGRADQFSYQRNQDGSLRKGSVEALPRAEFEKLLDRVETQMREMGRAIFSGVAKVDPYHKGSETPCDFCDYRAACRIDPWTHRYRVLRSPPEEISS